MTAPQPTPEIQFAKPPQTGMAKWGTSLNATWSQSFGWTVLVSFLGLGLFLIWLVTTIAPIVAVEIRYQYQTFLHEQLHVSDLRSILVPNFNGVDLMARTSHKDYGIVIPKLFIDEPVVFNVDPNDDKVYLAALKEGIAHASGTSFPDQAGLGYYFAHSSHPDFRSQYNAIFYLLNKLESDDAIYIWHDGQRYEYQVIEKRFTGPKDVSFLTQMYDQETIVLQTCWPPGTSSQRLLVFAKRVLYEN